MLIEAPKSMAIVQEKTEKWDHLDMKHGILLGSLTRNQFKVDDYFFLVPYDVCTKNIITRIRVLKSDSICEGNLLVWMIWQ